MEWQQYIRCHVCMSGLHCGGDKVVVPISMCTLIWIAVVKVVVELDSEELVWLSWNGRIVCSGPKTPSQLEISVMEQE